MDLKKDILTTQESKIAFNPQLLIALIFEVSEMLSSAGKTQNQTEIETKSTKNILQKGYATLKEFSACQGSIKGVENFFECCLA